MTPSVRRGYLLLAVVVVGWVVAQVLLVGVHRAPSWDEAVYYAKASPDLPTITWDPVRALGFPALLAPVIAAGSGLTGVRIELLLVNAVVAFSVYATWARRIGAVAAAGAAVLLLSSWVGLFYGTELYPNLFVALTLSGAVAAALRTGDARPSPVIAGIFMTVASCTRPTDAVLVVLVVAPALAWFDRRRALAPIAALAAGTVLGWVVWFVEAFFSFDGPLARWRDAFERTPVRDPRSGVLTALVHRAPGSALLTPGMVAALAWVGVWSALAVAGVVVARRRGRGTFAAAVVPAAAAALLLATYAVYWSDTGARFFLPGFALLTVPAGSALAAATDMRRSTSNSQAERRIMPGAAAAVAVVALVAVNAVAHGVAAHGIARDERATRAVWRATGETLARVANGRPCAFVSQYAFPQIELASGCDGTQLRFDTSRRVPRSFTRRDAVRFAVGIAPPAPGSPVSRWRQLGVPDAPSVRVFLAPDRPAANP